MKRHSKNRRGAEGIRATRANSRYDVLKAIRGFVRPRMRPFLTQVRAAIQGNRLPPGSLRLVRQEFNADQRFLIKRAEALGPIFKVNLNGGYTTCVVGHERAMHLIATNEDQLPGEVINVKRLFPIGLPREMTGETHQRYRHLFIQAMKATPLSVLQEDSERIIRDGLAILAQVSPPPAGTVIRDQLGQMTARIMLRVLFGLREGVPGYSELEAAYRRFDRFDPKAPGFCRTGAAGSDRVPEFAVYRFSIGACKAAVAKNIGTS